MTGSRANDVAKVLIVGASGFVGAAVVQTVLGRQDLTPIACMRRRSRSLYRYGVETRICNAADPAALERALDGVTYAVNCVLGSPATMLAVTRNLCEAASRSGLRRIVHLSSIAIYGPAIGVVDEITALRPVGPYARAKVECEAVIRNFVAAGGDAVVIRPGCVYGPRGEQWVGRIARWLRAGRLGELGDMAGGSCNLTFNDDLATAVVCALTAPHVTGESFNIAEADPGTWNQYFVRLASAIGTPIRPIPRLRMHFEAALLAPPLQLAKIAARRIGVRAALFPEPITPSLLRLWRQSMRLDSSKADALLKFSRTPPEQALARSAAWFRSTALT